MDFLEEYIKDCHLRNLEKRTIESYRCSVKSFLRFYPEPARATKYDVMDYLRYLQNKGVRMSTIHRDFSAISGLYEYLIFCDTVVVNPVKQIKSRYLNQPEEPERRYIPEVNELRCMIETIKDVRDRAMIIFVAKTAGRRGEVLDLDVRDIDMIRQEIYWPHKKKRRIRLGFMDSELIEVMRDYLDWREPRAKTSSLWISNRGGRVHKDYINEILAYYAHPLGLHDPDGPLYKRLTCHCLRGFLTTQLQRAGLQETYIQWIRGDSLKKETWKSNYLKMDTEIIRDEYERCVPQLLVKRDDEVILDEYQRYMPHLL